MGDAGDAYETKWSNINPLLLLLLFLHQLVQLTFDLRDSHVQVENTSVCAHESKFAQVPFFIIRLMTLATHLNQP